MESREQVDGFILLVTALIKFCVTDIGEQNDATYTRSWQDLIGHNWFILIILATSEHMAHLHDGDLLACKREITYITDEDLIDFWRFFEKGTPLITCSTLMLREEKHFQMGWS